MDERVERILNEAKQAISDAEFNYGGERYHVVVNRAYYAVFHCVQALLQSKGIFPKTHIGAHRKFRELFIKTGEMDIEFGETLAKVAELRNLSDYDYGATISQKQAKIAIENARSFFERVHKVLQTK